MALGRARWLFLALMIVAISSAALGGVAQARDNNSPCTTLGQGFHGQVGQAGIVCGPPTTVPHGGAQATYLGGGLACPYATWVGGTDYWSTAFPYEWDWDYSAESGWISWNGLVEALPESGVISSGQPGYESMAAGVYNWWLYSDYDAEIFWKCASFSTNKAGGPSRAAALAPLTPSGDEGDNNLRGDENDNSLVGLGGDDSLVGRDGEDFLDAGEGDDSLLAGDHDDQVYARAGTDQAFGGGGDDTLLTGEGDDRSRGGTGDDRLFDNQGRDQLRGGPGNDRFSAHDGDRDVIRCGAGTDVAVIDRVDRAIGCERVYRSARDATGGGRRADA